MIDEAKEKAEFDKWLQAVGGPHLAPNDPSLNFFAQELKLAYWTGWMARANKQIALTGKDLPA